MKDTNKSKGDQSSYSTDKSVDVSKQCLNEEIQLKICDIDTPQFICEDILCMRSQQYNVRVSSSKALCYVISKKQFQQKFPRESVEMVKQLFVAKYQRRTDMINQQIEKYKDKFKTVERQSSLSSENQKFKQKFKKQYLNKIFNESLLKMNVEYQDKQNKELQYVFEKTEQEKKDEKEVMFKKYKEAKAFISNSSNQFNIFSEIHDYIDDENIHKEYQQVMNVLKNGFSDFLLEVTKKAVDQNCQVSNKQKASINNHKQFNQANKDIKTLNTSNLYSQLRLSIIDEGEGFESKRSSIHTPKVGTITRNSILSGSPTLIIHQSIDEASPSRRRVIQNSGNPSSSLRLSIDSQILRKSLLMKPEGSHKVRKSSMLSILQDLFNQQDGNKRDSTSRKSSSKELDKKSSEDILKSIVNSFSDQINENERKQMKTSESPSNFIPLPKAQTPIENKIASPQSKQSQFKYKAEMNFSSLLPALQLNTNIEKLNFSKIQKPSLSMNSTPKQRSAKLNTDQSQSSPKSKPKQQTLTQPAEEEKSLLLEGTFNMGYGNLKQLEMDLKWELKNRGLLKVDSHQSDIKNFFPALQKYQREKIEMKVQRIKDKQHKLESHAFSNIQISSFKDCIPFDSQSVKISEMSSPILLEHNISPTDKQSIPFDFDICLKQNPSVRVDFNTKTNTSILSKQYSSPVIPAKSSAQNSIEPPLFLPKIKKTTQSVQIPVLNNQNSLNSQCRQSPSTSFFKNSSILSSVSGSTVANKNQFHKQNSRGRLEEFDSLQGIKCGSPLSQKQITVNSTPATLLLRQAQSAQEYLAQMDGPYMIDKVLMSSQSTRIKQPSPSTQMKDAVIQTQQYSKSNEVFYSSDNLTNTLQKKKDIEMIRPRITSEQGQNMLQRINYSRPVIFHNILSREKKPYTLSNVK